MKRRSAWLFVLLLLLLATVNTAAADTIRQGANGAMLADGTALTGVWNNGNDEFLTLKADGGAILYVSKTLYACSWTWDAEAVRLNHNGWILTVTPENGRLQAEVHGKTLTLTRAGDFADNAGMWYPTAKGGSYTLQLRASGEYRLRQGTSAAVTGQWLDAGGYVILMQEDGTCIVCIREGDQLELKVGLSTYTLRQEAQPAATPGIYATPGSTPAPEVDARMVGCWRPSGNEWSLLLNGDGTAVLGDGKQVETGFWQLSGNRCTIATSSQTCEGTYNGVFIRMTVGGKTLSFSRKGEAMDVTGVWAADGYALAISADGSFAGSWGGGAYSGSWLFDGQNAYLSGSNGLTVFKVVNGKLQIKADGKTAFLVRSGEATKSTVLSVPDSSGTENSNASGKSMLPGKWSSGNGYVSLVLYADGTALWVEYGIERRCSWSQTGNAVMLTENGAPVVYGYCSSEFSTMTVTPDGLSVVEYILYKEGSVTGSWREVVHGSDVKLVIRQNGTAELTVFGSVYECTWKLNGGVLQLTNNGVPVTGAYDSKADTIYIAFGAMPLSFVRTGK